MYIAMYTKTYVKMQATEPKNKMHDEEISK
jgi:hypothetical protein